MIKKLSWICVAALMVVSVVLVSCQQATTPTTSGGTTVTGKTTPSGTTSPTTTQPTTTPATAISGVPTTPVYGGVGVFGAPSSPTQWDPGYVMHAPYSYFSMYEGLICIDWPKGPQGTKDYTFDTQAIPAGGVAGLLAESWEITAKNVIIYHLRKGIRFQNKAPANGREVVASDFVYAIQRTQNSPRSSAYKAPGTAPEKYVQAVALEKYTLQVTNPTAILSPGAGQIGYGAIYPPEAVTQYGNLEDWKNACGTGPWILTDFVPDSSLTFKKNPNYWRYDPLHPANKLPYMDGYRTIVLPDVSTQMAAIRTGKQAFFGTTIDNAQNLIKTSPQLRYVLRPSNYNIVVFWRNDKAPFTDIRVRKALAKAIDRGAVLKDFMQGQGIYLAWPFYPFVGTDMFVPVEQLPADTADIYKYDPAAAKKLLVDAGYPTGFKMQLDTPNVQMFVDRAGIVKNYWDAIGVSTTVNVVESGAFYQSLYGKTYLQANICSWGNTSEYSTIGWAWYTGRIYNYGMVSDKTIDTAYDLALDTVDTAARNKILHDAGLYGISQCWDYELPAPYDYVFFQPWIGGYAGEYPDLVEGFQAHIWLDPAIQKQYQK